MLSSRTTAPRNGVSATGLPSGPRSRSVGRTRERETSSSHSTGPDPERPSMSSRSLRPQRSFAKVDSASSYSEGRGRRMAPPANLRDRSRPPPLPSTPHARSIGPHDYGQDREDGRLNRMSHTSSSSSSSSSSGVSSGSSFLDRMKSSRSGYASSRTSLEEDAEPPKRDYHQKPQRPAVDTRSPLGAARDESDSEASPLGGIGAAVWSRVADAAGSLTVNVSKAWASNIALYSGEETPEGQESHLTRAMKAYHLEKARDPSDLPEWLFSERERHPGLSRHERSDKYEEHVPSVPVQEPSRSRGLRDIYDSVAAESRPPEGTPQRGGASERGRYGDDRRDVAPSKATDRLKAIRDAKRNANTSSSTVREEEDHADRGARAESHATDSGRRPPARVGLPSGPSRRRI